MNKDKTEDKKKGIKILKMTQKFDLDPWYPAETQIKKTEFNLEKKRHYIYYHYKEGKITAK